jgi:hypothetical protein
MLSGNVSYFFGGQRVRPYVTGSVGVLWTESVNSLTIASSTEATLSEFHESDTGLAIGIASAWTCRSHRRSRCARNSEPIRRWRCHE